MILVSAFFTSKSAACISLRRMFSTSSPTYPASVKAVASAMAKGTLRILASVWARRVLPLPVGPMSNMLDFELRAVRCLGAHRDPLVVVVDGDGEDPLRLVLSNDVLVEDAVDLTGLGEVVVLEELGSRELLVYDLVAELDALVADVDARARYEPDLALALPAERALQLIGRILMRLFPSPIHRPCIP